MKNKIKKEYENSGSVSGLNLKEYTDWAFALTRNDIDQFVRLTADNRKLFTASFGAPAFTWIDSDRRRNLVWRFVVDHGFVVYVFTGDRGTSYEISNPREQYAIGRLGGDALVDFVKEKIVPVISPPAKPRLGLRQTWRPRRPEMPVQCASCPFRDGNDAEFAEVMKKIASKHGERPSLVNVKISRIMVKDEVSRMGDFSCHQSAYDKDMNVRDMSEHKQCPGASRHYRETDPS